MLGSGAVLEAPAVVAGLDDFAVMGEPVEQRGGHLGVAEDARPFGEGEVVVTMIEVRWNRPGLSELIHPRGGGIQEPPGRS